MEYSQTIYVHCRGKYIFYLYELQKQVESELFCPVLQRVQMNYIFFDNVRILYLFCNVKKPKTTAKQYKKSRKKCHSNLFFFNISSVKSTLILLPFLTITQRESGIRKAISWSVTLYNKKIIQSMQFDCSNRTSTG